MRRSRFPKIATVLILAALASLYISGCGKSHGRNANSAAQQDLDYRHQLHQRVARGDSSAVDSYPEPRVTAPTVSAIGAPRGQTSAVDTAGPMRKYALHPSQIAGPPQSSGPRDVILRPGDVIEVKFFYTPELDVTQAVRPDGKIALQLVGEVTAEGKTPAQVRDLLLHLYESHLKDPRITILLKSQYDRRVFVGGEVIRPGVLEMPGDMTASEAIMEAGGFDMEEAKVDNVIVIRQTASHWQGYKIDMKPMLEGYGTEPFYLHPRDIVYVPRTKIAKIDQWIEQHINKLIPRIPLYFSIPTSH